MVAILQNSTDAYSWGPGRGLGNEGCSLRLGSLEAALGQTRPWPTWQGMRPSEPRGHSPANRASAGLHVSKAKRSYVSLCHPDKKVRVPSPASIHGKARRGKSYCCPSGWP